MKLISQCYLAGIFSCLEMNILEEEWELGILADRMPLERYMLNMGRAGSIFIKYWQIRAIIHLNVDW